MKNYDQLFDLKYRVRKSWKILLKIRFTTFGCQGFSVICFNSN